MTADPEKLKRALDSGDPHALAHLATAEELERLKLAEAVLEARRQRERRPSRFTLASQVLVGWVALLGLCVNAFQSYVNKKQQDRQMAVDQERWSREFDRAQRADKYRAFFETSILATDPANRDKRLVGYALLEEFVADVDYDQKAALMLEESLLQELRRHRGGGLDPDRDAAIEAILFALGRASQCDTLEHAARSLDKIVQGRQAVTDKDDLSRLFGLYVRRLVGRAVVVCESPREFRAVREPLRSSLMRTPELAGMTGELTREEANLRLAQVLRADCTQEAVVSGGSECPKVLRGFAQLCQGLTTLQDGQEEARACAAIQEGVEQLPSL